jgi:hypothetical protein
VSELLTADRRARIAAEIDRRTKVCEEADDGPSVSLWRFVRGIVDDYEATVLGVERMATLVRRDVAALQGKLSDQREILERATRCRLCDGKGEYHVAAESGEPGAMTLRTCLLCDFNGRRIDELHAFLVFAVGAKDRVEVPQDSVQVLEGLHDRAVQLMDDPVYNLIELARGGGESED